jgi:ABC-type glycerol-3-phosphate transport system substrate-binding protein
MRRIVIAVPAALTVLAAVLGTAAAPAHAVASTQMASQSSNSFFDDVAIAF